MVIWSSPKPHFHSLQRVYNLQILSQEVGILDEFYDMPFGLSNSPKSCGTASSLCSYSCIFHKSGLNFLGCVVENME